MKKHDRSLAAIITAKADFLITLQHNLGQQLGARLTDFREKRRMIDRMPRRGLRQREKQAKALQDLHDAMDRFYARVGTHVMNTYCFCEDHRDHLRPGVRKMLLGSDS
jgi:hypothetical protein